MANDNKANLAIVMITFNEEHHIGSAIDNVKDFASEIYVLDSLSTDRTVDIALEKGATVLQRRFTNFGDQWNFALGYFPIQSAWTMKMDPDERLTDALKDEIRRLIAGDKVDSFSCTLRLWFMHRPLKSTISVLRGWKTGTCRFSLDINEKPVVSGTRHVQLKQICEHLDTANLHLWNAKQNLYTTMEAVALYKYFQEPRQRGWTKYDVFRIPFRFALIYLYHLLYKGAIFEGRVGWAWARLRTDVYRMQWYKYLEFVHLGKAILPEKPKVGDYHPKVLQTELQQSIMQVKEG